MLTHKKNIIAFIVLLLVLILADQQYDIAWWIYAILTTLFLSVEIFGAVFISSNFHLRAINKGLSKERTIAITFDDGPDTNTAQVLDALKENNIKATFFMIGHKIASNRDMVRRVFEEGHVIANHSYEHNFWFDLKNKAELIRDLQQTSEMIKDVTGKFPLYFRPPYGVTTPAIAKATKYLGYHVVGWNIRSLDTKIRDRKQLLTRIKKRISPGSILLLHDTLNGTDLVIQDVVAHLKELNYKVIPLDQLIGKNAYA